MKLRNILTLLIFTISFSSFGQSKKLFRIIENGKVGYIDGSGQKVIDTKYFNGEEFSEGLAAVRENGRYGYINSLGAYVIKPKYDHASNFYNGFACVYIDGDPLLIDKTEKIVVDRGYQSIWVIDSSRALVQTKSNKQGIVNLLNQKLIVDTIFRSISNFTHGVAVVTQSKKKGKSYDLAYAVIDSCGKFVVHFGKFIEISGFVDGYSRVELEDEHNKDGHIDGVIDTKGNLLFQRPYKNHSYISEDFHDGLAIVTLYKYWIPEEEGIEATSEKNYEGFINLKGEVVLNDTLNRYLKAFSCGRTFLEDNKRNYRIVDTNFQPVGNDTFDNIKNDGFKNGYAIVEKEDGWGIIDRYGHFVVKPEYEEIHEIGVLNNYFMYAIEGLENDKLYGIGDINGDKITGPIIQDFDPAGFVNGLIKTEINNRLTYIDTLGNIVWQERQTNNLPLEALNIDFMNRGYYYAYSKPNDNDLGGFAASENRPRKISTEHFPENKLSLIVHPEETDTFGDNYFGFRVYIANTFKRDIDFNAQDSRLYMKVQAKAADGKWRDIEYLPSSWCGNSYHTLTLGSGHYWTFVTPKYEGEVKTKMRIELSYLGPTNKSEKRNNRKELTIYSNEYDGAVNPGQFWNKRPYYRNGIMDPYNE